MQCYLWVKILNLDDNTPKSFLEFFEGLVIYLSKIGQGGRGHAVRSAGCVLHIEVFDEVVKVIYGSWWESTILGQCHSLEGH